MTYGGYGPGGPYNDPYGGNRYGGPPPQPAYYPPQGYPPSGYGPPPAAPPPQKPGGRGGLVAMIIVGLVLLVAVIGIVWKVAGDGGGHTVASSTPTSKAGAHTHTVSPETSRPRSRTTQPPTSSSAPATPPNAGTTTVDALKSGDCVEIREESPDPNNPNTSNVTIYKVSCEGRDGVYQVLQVVEAENDCPDTTESVLYNGEETVFACMRGYA